MTWDQLYLSWTQPNNLLEGYSIDNYAIVINGRSYFTNDTRIAISITDAELAINGEYNVSVNPSYCRGEGMTANATVVIANSELNGTCDVFRCSGVQVIAKINRSIENIL